MLKVIQHMASKNIIESRENQANQANKWRREAPQYTVSQQVLLSMKHIKRKTSTTSKLQAPWEGPFKITCFWPETNNVKLELPAVWKIHKTFHTPLIKTYHANDDKKFLVQSHKRPPPIPE